MLLSAADLPPILVPADEQPGVHRAAADLADDLARILGRRPELGVWSGTAPERALIIGSNLDGQLEGWQASRVRIDGEHAWFTGSDRCGTMWAVYRACELLLGVDPLQVWTEHPPVRRDNVTLHDLPLEAPVLRHRGWFLNDEDLLSEWLPGGGERQLDYPFYRQVIAPLALDRVLEAAVRLRLDLVIPASFIDLANPAEAALVEAAVARGLYVTQHHIEPLGVSHFTLEKWAKARGLSVPSYVSQPELVRACWRDYARLWARFGEQVLWTVGLRGRGDRPVWMIDPQVDTSPTGRGRLISAAMADQAAIVREVCGRSDPTLLTVLWAEMADLHAEGHLDIPADIVRVLCDHGPSQVWCTDFARLPRSGIRSGIYYHAGFWGDGPHLVQGVRPARISAMLGDSLSRGDHALALLNIANLRETCLAARQCADLWWSGTAQDEDRVLTQWCVAQYGDPALAGHYRDLFDAYADMGSEHGAAGLTASLSITGPDRELIERHGAPLLDGATLHKGEQALRLITDLLVGKPAGQIHWRPAEAGLALLRPWAASMAQRFTAVAERIAAAIPSIRADRRPFATAHLLVQARTMAAIAGWCLQVCDAAMAMLARDQAAAAEALSAAAAALEAGISQRAVAATGIWEGWYRGDRKMNLPRTLQQTRQTIATLTGAAT